MLLLLAQVACAGDLQIQAHLFEVADTLRTESPATLSDEVRQRRLEFLDLLEDYAAGGVFPANDAARLPAPRVALPPRAFAAGDDGRAPTFVDDSGVHCAVGYLMGVDRPDLVARVVGDANEAYLPEMRVDGVADWADWAGFTLDELAWIQPEYPTRVGTCPDDLSSFVWEAGTHFDQRDECGAVSVSVQQFQDPCEMCGEGHAINVELTNHGTDDAVVDLVVRSAAGTELGREQAVAIEAERRLGLMVMVPRWQDVTNTGATLSVEAEGNCVEADEHTITLSTWSDGSPLDRPRCGALARACSTTDGPATLLVALLGLVGLVRRCRRRRGARGG